jgi:hypothetical protein
MLPAEGEIGGERRKRTVVQGAYASTTCFIQSKAFRASASLAAKHDAPLIGARMAPPEAMRFGERE